MDKENNQNYLILIVGVVSIVMFVFFIQRHIIDNKEELNSEYQQNITNLNQINKNLAVRIEDCKNSKKTVCPSCDVCETCEVCEEPKELNYSNNEKNKIKADLMINLARNKQSGFYDDILDLKYESAEDKLKYSVDYIEDALGYYNLADINKSSDFYKAYENLLECFKKIKLNINGLEDDEEKDVDDILGENTIKHCKYYDVRILKHNLNTEDDVQAIKW